MTETVIKALCQALRYFKLVTCPRYKMKELPREVHARTARQQAQAASDVNQNVPKKVKGKRFNMSTYKMHCIPDYPDAIRKYGTTDSYSTQTVGYVHFITKSTALTVAEQARAPSIQDVV